MWPTTWPQLIVISPASGTRNSCGDNEWSGCLWVVILLFTFIFFLFYPQKKFLFLELGRRQGTCVKYKDRLTSRRHRRECDWRIVPMRDPMAGTSHVRNKQWSKGNCSQSRSHGHARLNSATVLNSRIRVTHVYSAAAHTSFFPDIICGVKAWGRWNLLEDKFFIFK